MEKKTSRKQYLLAFFLPFLLAVLVCVQRGVYPFGDNCILHIDMYHQYEPFFTELMDKLKQKDSLFYSFRIGLGSDFVSLIAYYLASPLNVFLIVCPADHVIEFMTVLILLKIGMCGLTMTVYLHGHYRKNNWLYPVFGCFYALSGYMAAYSWDIMWLDCLVLLPVIILGLERLVEEQRGALYGLALGISILSNFYISIMICIYVVLYFFCLFFGKTRGIRQKAKTLCRFTWYSLLAGAVGAVLIIPEAVILSYSGSSGIGFPDTVEWYFDLISMLARHCIDVDVYTGRDHWPNLYCGTAVFLFLVLYLTNRKIRFRKKAASAGLIACFWLGFSNNILDFIWHGLHFPDSLPGRQSFLYIFLLLTMACEVCEKKEGNRFYDVIAGVVVSAGLFVLAAYFGQSGQVAGDALLLSAVLTGAYGLLFLLWHFGKEQQRSFALFVCVMLSVFEVYVNFDLTGFDVTGRTAYTKNWDSVKKLLQETREQNTKEQNTDVFYRTEEMERLTKNDAAIYGYESSTIFSSLMNIGVSEFYRKVGMEGGKNFYSYSGSTLLTSAMLSVRYLISQSPEKESPVRTLVASDGSNYIYENKYWLPLGFGIGEGVMDSCSLLYGLPVRNLNSLAQAFGAKTDLLQPFDGTVDAGENATVVTPETDGYLYAVYSDTSVTNLTVKAGDRIRRFNKCDHGYLLDLGWCKAGVPVEVTNTSQVSNFALQVYRMDLTAMDQAYETLSQSPLTIDTMSDTDIRGHITMKEDGNLVCSIPGEAGWQIFADGEEVEMELFEDSLLSIPLTKGEHQIRLRYRTPGLAAGAAVSFGGILLLVVSAVMEKRRIYHADRDIYQGISSGV